MFSKKPVLVLSCLSALSLAACTGNYQKIDMRDAEYWQRNSASSSLYLNGPKAQQMLHQDIARCTWEINELENLGEIREEIPANYYSGNTEENRTASQQELDHWDSPERDGYLLNEHLDYHDFETCMMAKGWERMEYMPHDVADRARQEYIDQYRKKKKSWYNDREYVTTLHPYSQNPPPYENTNE
jgi:hypothetical protein